MSFPAIFLGFVISTLIGAGFHALRGGGGGKFLLDLILSWLGFWLGQFLAGQLGIHFLSLGSLHLGVTIPFTLIFLFTGNWLSPVETPKQPRSR